MDNQQVLKLNMTLEDFYTYGIAELIIHPMLSKPQVKLFILNINERYSFFKAQFNFSRDVTKLAKRRVFKHYELSIPIGFRLILEYPKYMINHQGVIANIRTRKILKPALCIKGYQTVCLTNKATVKIHRLVAKAFLDNPNKLPQVNHIDGVKTNNSVSNLEWCTNSENSEHKVRLGLGKTEKSKLKALGEKNNMVKLTEIDVLTIRTSHLSKEDLAENYNVSVSNIYAILSRRSWKHI